MTSPRSACTDAAAARSGGDAGADGSRAAPGTPPAAATAAASGLLARAARGTLARALSLLQDDSLLLSWSTRLLLLTWAVAWQDSGSLVLCLAFAVKRLGASDAGWLQERVGELTDLYWSIGGLKSFTCCMVLLVLYATHSPHCSLLAPAGLLMLLRWAASFLLPTRGPWASIAAATAAHTIAVHSRCGMAAGCTDSACRRQKQQAILLVHLMRLAYWLPMVWACWTIGAALWSTAWHGALLLQGPALRALTFYVLSCEHWWLRWELESLAFRSEVTEAHRQLLHASRQVATDFGRWPLLIVRNLIAALGSQVWGCAHVSCRGRPCLLLGSSACPPLLTSTSLLQQMARPAHGTMAFATSYVAAQCAAIPSQDPARLIDATQGAPPVAQLFEVLCRHAGDKGCMGETPLSLPCCAVLRRIRWLTQPHSIASTSLHHLLPPASEWPAMHLAMQGWQSPTTAMSRQELTTPMPLGPCLHMQGYCPSNCSGALSTPCVCSSMWRQQPLFSRR